MKAGRTGVYLGETSRTIHERAVEHLRDATSFSQKSHQVKHWMNSHPEEDAQPAFRIKTVQRYRDCLSRQIGEALKIYYSKDQLLNSKNEYVQNCISRVVANEESWERRERERREEEEEEKEKWRLERFREEKSGVHDRMEATVELSSLQEETDPNAGVEKNITVLGGWIKKRRESVQLDGEMTHKKARVTQEDDTDETIPEGGFYPAGDGLGVEENATNDEVSSEGGPGHQLGGGAPLQQINTRACVLIDRPLPEGGKDQECTETRKSKSKKSSQQEGKNLQPDSQRKPAKKSKPGTVMNLAWLSYWWKRMEREAAKEQDDFERKKDGNRLREQFARVSGINHTFEPESESVIFKSDDVVIGRHPEIDETNERHPATVCDRGQGYHLRGNKRYLPGETASPSKRRGEIQQIENPVVNSTAGGGELQRGRQQNNNYK